MRPVRDLWAQMVEQRLWPIALVLVVALVAVPLVLAKSPDPAAEEAAAEAPAVAAASAAADLRDPGEPVVAVASERLVRVPLRGRPKNPFAQQFVQQVVQDTTELAIVADPGGPPQPPPGGGGGGGPSTPGGDERPAEPETFTYASIDVRFGRAGSPLRLIRDVPRLTALPRASNPIVIFLGMRGDHETALFMVSTDVHTQGDRRCVPSPVLCEAIELRRDDVAFLDVRAADGTVTQYELDLVDVTLHETTSAGKAARTIARTSRLRGQLEVGGPLGRAGATRAVPRPPDATASAAALTPLP